MIKRIIFVLIASQLMSCKQEKALKIVYGTVKGGHNKTFFAIDNNHKIQGFYYEFNHDNNTFRKIYMYRDNKKHGVYMDFDTLGRLYNLGFYKRDI